MSMFGLLDRLIHPDAQTELVASACGLGQGGGGLSGPLSACGPQGQPQQGLGGCPPSQSACPPSSSACGPNGAPKSSCGGAGQPPCPPDGKQGAQPQGQAGAGGPSPIVQEDPYLAELVKQWLATQQTQPQGVQY